MKTIKEMVAVMLAFKYGKRIQFRNHGSQTWCRTGHPSWDWSVSDYRVEPEKVVRYVNIYDDGTLCPHPTLDRAKQYDRGATARVRVEYVEGQFDE